MMGCPVAWKCLVACLLGESSQQPTWPQVRQIRKCSHTLPLFRHSSQPSALGVTSRMPAIWVQPFAMLFSWGDLFGEHDLVGKRFGLLERRLRRVAEKLVQ